MMDALYSYVRQHDYESYIAALLTKDPMRQRHVMAVFAFRCELRHVAEITTEPMAGWVRLAWWRERVADIYQTLQAPAQPTLQALSEFIRLSAPPEAWFNALLEQAGETLEGRRGEDDRALEALIACATGEKASKTSRFRQYCNKKNKANKDRKSMICLPLRALWFDLLTK